MLEYSNGVQLHQSMCMNAYFFLKKKVLPTILIFFFGFAGVFRVPTENV